MRAGALALLCAACGAVNGQPRRIAFEVVSVKASGTNRIALTSGQSVPVRFRDVTYTGRRVTCDTDLKSIVREAFSLKDHEIVAPDWISTQTYEVIAVAPEGTTKEDSRRMLQTMLQERFGLRFHRESKEVSVQALVVGKDGFKGRPADPSERYTSSNGTGLLTATAITLDRLADWLSRIGSVQVVNRTGLDGSYGVDLHWQPEDGEARRGFGLPAGLVAALEEQLGIRLEKRKIAVDLLVIDAINKTPTGN